MRYLVYIFLFNSCFLSSQILKKQKDSLQIIIQKTNNDSVWVHNTDVLAGIIALENPPLAEKMYYEVLDKLNKNSYQYLNKLTDIASIYDGLGILERRRNNYDKTLAYYLKALHIKEQLKDSIDMGRSFNNIAMLYNAKKDYDKALAYMHKALSLRKLGDSVGYAISLNSYGYFLYKKKAMDSALIYFNKAKQYYGNNMRSADANNNIARIYRSQKKYNEALKLRLQSLEIFKKFEKRERIANTLKDLAIDSRKLKDFNAAQNYLDQSETIAKAYGNKTLISVLYKERYRISKAKQKLRTSFNTL